MNTPYQDIPPQPPDDGTGPTRDLSDDSRKDVPEYERVDFAAHPLPADPLAPPDALQPGIRFAYGPLGWLDLLYLILFYVVGGLVLGTLVAGASMFVFHMSFPVWQKSPGIQASVMIVTQALLSGATMVFLYLLVRGRTTAPFWPSVGWRPLSDIPSRTAIAARYLVSGIALAVIVGILGRYVNTQSAPMPLERMFRNRGSVLLLMALGVLIAPLVEETIFRGCIYPIIAGRFGIATGVLVTGTIFGLAHAQQLGFAWGQVSLLILVGIIFTWVRARAGTVAASYCMHLGYNSILFTLFYLATSGLKNLPGS